ncbi:hypothetical protein DEU56DRAFT_771423 [Suillus clintonianus]|uniref:uncharacterized protein n=1 Tax=Suillus clintonianus TaxID=1904413 RepID=UPI001B87AB9B|nr:uncharacterized protein DEU56DRAFT_771423 [Suillus clintonianus]KAG2153859.1 hypothetical protein DEU56DRAFT_771423 [Suillus clintonianus]
MSHAFVRNLTFQSNDLGKEATLMLTFDTMEGLYEDFFPVVWKVSTFGKTGPYRAHATYTSQLAFSIPQVLAGNIVDAETSVKINDSEKTVLTQANNVYHFSPPQAGTSGVLQAVNNTGALQNIAVGFVAPGELMPKPALFFEGVGDESHVTAKFTPVLRAYITSDYQETAIIRGAIDTPAVWTQNLAGLAASTTWELKRDLASGHYTITAV